MIRWLWFSALCWLLALPFAVKAETLPAWLQQVATGKYRQPQQMLQLLEQNRLQFDNLSPVQQAIWLNEHATINGVLGNYAEQQQSAEQGLALLASDNTALKAELLYQLGFATEMQTAYVEAIDLYQQGIELASVLKDERLILLGHVNLAAAMVIQDQLQPALSLLKETYQRAVTLNDKEVLASVNSGLGGLYVMLSLEPQAITFFEEALALYDTLDWPSHRITVLFYLARTYSFTNAHEKALQTYQTMLRLSQQTDNNVYLYHAYFGMAITSSQSGSRDIALTYMDKAEQYLSQVETAYYLPAHYYEKARIYQALNQSSAALQQLLMAEQFLSGGQISDDNTMLMAMSRLKAQLLAELGQYDKAYQELNKFVNQFSEVRDKEKEQAVEQIRQGLDYERQVVRNILLQSENEQNLQQVHDVEYKLQRQLIWIWILAGSVFLLLLLIWQLWQRRKVQQRINTADR